MTGDAKMYDDYRLGVNQPAWPSTRADQVYQCGCIGPQDGAPVCPCRMRSLRIQHGRYVEIIDHGPAPSTDDAS